MLEFIRKCQNVSMGEETAEPITSDPTGMLGLAESPV